MESISSRDLAQSLLNHYIEGRPEPDGYLRELVARASSGDAELAAFASKALFGILIEGLADRFEPALCDAYASLFARVLEQIRGIDPASLMARYRALQSPDKMPANPERVIVLSRVTLGADVAITSILLDAAKQKFPKAAIGLAGSHKAWELFEKDPRIHHVPVPYPRSGTLRGRLAPWADLDRIASEPGTLVLDPDSRLTQLGMLPVGDPARYLWFPSRSFGGGSADSLPALAARWVRGRLGVDEAVPYIAPKFRFNFEGQRIAAVSLGVGENPAKRMDEEFEAGLLRLLASNMDAVIADRGAGGEEAARVERAIARSGAEIGIHDGAFASFAALIAASSFYAGYDSAGQHVAAALGVPMATVFKGYVSERMFQRWYPDGPGPRTVIRVEGQSNGLVLAGVEAALRAAAP